MSKTKSNLAKKSSKRKQKLYRMKGCSKKTRKNYLGGSSDAPLAYTGQPIKVAPNPFFAYTGKGGSSCGLSNPSTIPVNTNAVNPTIPNTGPVSVGSTTIFNNASTQRGGSCGCGLPFMTGGCGPLCAAGFMIGGTKHRVGCKCSDCKMMNMKKSNMTGGNSGIPYPNGLVGSPITPNPSTWPGVNGIPGDSNYYPLNQYKVDPQTAMVDLGANKPFLGGKKRKQKGGTLSNFMGQDLINLGRQFQFGIGTAYNALAGYSAPVNPLPWKDQLTKV
jgi:hypothetical protein